MFKNKSLLVLLVLIIVWSLFFAIYKYFMWGVFKTDTITLQFISGYLSLGTIGAYVFGGLFYELFREKKYHFVTAFFTILGLVGIYIGKQVGITTDAKLVACVTLGLGFFYGLWGVLRNILISTLIHETNLGETKVNGLANIAFITSIILGSILGGVIAEKMMLHGIIIIVGLLIIGLIAGLQLYSEVSKNTQTIKQRAIIYKNNFVKDFIFIIKKYFLVMLFVSLIITIATIMSQKAIEYAVANLGKTGSEAAMILLYSAIGSIIGNLISMKIHRFKWYQFLLYSLLFAATINQFPNFFYSFLYTGILAFIAGIFFGITYNLLEACFFKMIAQDNKKSYGAASLGIVTSATIAGMMFFVDFIQKTAGYAGVYQLMGCMILFIGIVIYQIEGKLD